MVSRKVDAVAGALAGDAPLTRAMRDALALRLQRCAAEARFLEAQPLSDAARAGTEACADVADLSAARARRGGGGTHA